MGGRVLHDRLAATGLVALDRDNTLALMAIIPWMSPGLSRGRGASR
jgi:hypothetical protein